MRLQDLLHLVHCVVQREAPKAPPANEAIRIPLWCPRCNQYLGVLEVVIAPLWFSSPYE